MATYQLIALQVVRRNSAHVYGTGGIGTSAKRKGITIKVETHGQIGIENELTPAEIKERRQSLLPPTKTFKQNVLLGNELLMSLSALALKSRSLN